MSKENKIFVWDLHTRLFHWLLVVVFAVSMVTGLMGDIDIMSWHMRSGYALLGLLVFRLLSGFFGKDYGRFTYFPLSPSAVFSYLRGEKKFLGHNPLGSWMVLVMLLALLLQTLSGLMTSDDFFVEGPWVFWASEQWVSWAGFVHSNNYRLLLLLLAMHLLAIVFYRFFRGQKLIKPMLTGYKEEPESASAAEPIAIVRLLIMMIASAVFTGLVISLDLS